MNLTTNYLGFSLRSPLVASASPLSEKVDNVKRLEEAGVGAVVLYSLFEEQIRQEQSTLDHFLTHSAYSSAEAQSYFPQPKDYHTDPHGYLKHIRRCKEAVEIPIIASLNATTPGNWLRFADQIVEAGADALELNLYHVPTNMNMSGSMVEQGYEEIVDTLVSRVQIPVAVKLSPFFSNMAYAAGRFDRLGASALVLFNRFYQPDIDMEALEVRPNLVLSSSQELRLPLTWIALLYGRVRAHLGATSGVHTGEDAAKLLLAGAQVTMMASALIKQGIDHVRVVERELVETMEKHEYESVSQMRGALSQLHCKDPSAFERAQYMKALTFYQPGL